MKRIDTPVKCQVWIVYHLNYDNFEVFRTLSDANEYRRNERRQGYSTVPALKYKLANDVLRLWYRENSKRKA